MNHRDAGIFQAYINERVQFDVQAAFLGRPSADAVLKATSHRSRYTDPQAPTKPNKPEAIAVDPEILELTRQQNALSKEAKRMFGTIKAALGSDIHEEYTRANNALKALKVTLYKRAFRADQAQFFARIDTEEIDRQLDPSVEYVEWKPEVVEHEQAERRLVAELICQTPPVTEEAALEHRIRTIEALVALCCIQERAPKKN